MPNKEGGEGVIKVVPITYVKRDDCQVVPLRRKVKWIKETIVWNYLNQKLCLLAILNEGKYLKLKIKGKINQDDSHRTFTRLHNEYNSIIQTWENFYLITCILVQYKGSKKQVWTVLKEF